MRCDKARKALSDERDGRAPHDPDALARHLAGCPDCRAYGEDLRLIQSAASRRPAPARSAADWAVFERRLEAALDAGPGRRTVSRPARPFIRSRAWAAAVLMLLAAGASVMLFLRPGGADGDLVLTFEESLDRLSWSIGDDERLAEAFNETLLAAIDETLAGAESDPGLLANPDFLEGLQAAGSGGANRFPPAKM